MKRREFLVTGAAAGAAMGAGCQVTGPGPGPGTGPGTGPGPGSGAKPGVVVNDVHSELNETVVRRVVRPETVDELRALFRQGPASVCGSRHAMGGQQFGTDTTLLDLRGMDRVLDLDTERGVVEVEAGIEWPALNRELLARQPGVVRPWTIIQKQTGADTLSLGGALSANIHGRGLAMGPLVSDVESFDLLCPDGELRRCSRTGNRDWFRLAAGGYGLFGVITSLRLRLQPRRLVRRRVVVMHVRDLAAAVADRMREGYLYGDLQFATGNDMDEFLVKGVFSCHRPAPDDAPQPDDKPDLDEAEWKQFYHVAHNDKPSAYEMYLAYYLSTDGMVYGSDDHQFGVYLSGYHRTFNRMMRYTEPRSLMITEVYVPLEELFDFMQAARTSARELEMDIVYGTIRFIRRDVDTFLPWARRDFACIVMNLRVTHTPEGIARAKRCFRALIDRALERHGSFYLTYHRWATREQLLAAYPRMPEFLAEQRRRDPGGVIRSDWVRHLRTLLA